MPLCENIHTAYIFKRININVGIHGLVSSGNPECCTPIHTARYDYSRSFRHHRVTCTRIHGHDDDDKLNEDSNCVRCNGKGDMPTHSINMSFIACVSVSVPITRIDNNRINPPIRADDDGDERNDMDMTSVQSRVTFNKCYMILSTSTESH